MNTDKRMSFFAGLGFAEQEPREVLKTLSGLGYTGVEWTMSHFNPRTKSAAQLKELVDMTRDHGMEVSEIVVQQDHVTTNETKRKDRIELVKECILAASEAGANIINLYSGPACWDPEAPVVGRTIPEGDAWGMVFDAFDQFMPLAEKHRVYLAVEAVFGMLCRAYYTLKPLLDRYDSEYLAVNMDPSHYQLYKNDVPWVVRQLGSKIKHVHIKDVVGVPGQMGDSFVFPLPGEGVVNFKAFIDALDEVGYQGFLSLEFESFHYYEKVLHRNAAKAAALSMQAWKELL